jgi:hypothetical protein
MPAVNWHIHAIMQVKLFKIKERIGQELQLIC